MNKTSFLLIGPATLAWLVASSALAAENPNPAPQARLEQPADPNRFGLSYRFGLNISARFTNVGLSPAAAPGAAVGSVDHIYNDGYV